MGHLLSNTLAFIFALGVIVFVHEMGHLVMAKVFHIKVPMFSIGFGKRIWGFQIGETEYRVAILPLGGYVRLSGDDPGEVSDDPNDFLNKPRWQRVLVYLAGPASNGVLAIALMTGVFMVGTEVPFMPDLPPVVGEVAAGSPAAAVGVQPGDRVLEVDGKPVKHWEAVRFALVTSPEKPVRLRLRRGDQDRVVNVTPARVPKYEVGDAGIYPRIRPRITELAPGKPAAAAGFEVGDVLQSVDGRVIYGSLAFVRYIQSHPGQAVDIEVLRQGKPIHIAVVPADEDGSGRIGVGIGFPQKYGFGGAVMESLRYNWQITRQTIAALGKVVSGRMKARSALAGPIEIAALSGQEARRGFGNLIHLMALISVSIGLLNLFPVPVLDGGQIALLLVESSMRRDLSVKVKQRFQEVGFFLIIALMVIVLYFDLLKNLPAGLLPGS
jgi:regulator of sigma E protease